LIANKTVLMQGRHALPASFVFRAEDLFRVEEVRTMSSKVPLQGMDLINCAQANIKQGIEEAALQCGYGQNDKLFVETLEKACQDIGVTIHDLTDVGKNQDAQIEARGVIVAPDSLIDL
jgi:hypothetical protein